MTPLTFAILAVVLQIVTCAACLRIGFLIGSGQAPRSGEPQSMLYDQDETA